MHDLESLNKIEIRGTVGQVRFATVGEKKHANFSVMTEHAYKNREGEACCDVMWWSVSATEGPKNGIDNLEKGCVAHVLGRVRMRVYDNADGSTRSFPEVVASEVRVEQL